jgi:hypothetical protein
MAKSILSSVFLKQHQAFRHAATRAQNEARTGCPWLAVHFSGDCDKNMVFSSEKKCHQNNTNLFNSQPLHYWSIPKNTKTQKHKL